jgi:hypothetical protein
MEKNGEIFHIAIVGDCSNWNKNTVTQNDIPIEIRNLIGSCEIFIFNLEGPIIDDSILPRGVIRSTLLKFLLKKLGKAQPIVTNNEKILDVLNLSDNNIACLANNHMMDANKEGIEFTLKTLKSKNYKSGLSQENKFPLKN